jgi:hypothetical protein
MVIDNSRSPDKEYASNIQNTTEGVARGELGDHWCLARSPCAGISIGKHRGLVPEREGEVTAVTQLSLLEAVLPAQV